MQDKIPPPRIPWTHTSPAAIEILKHLPFFTKLKKNKRIEDQNDDRLACKADHTIDPVGNPDEGSNMASLITLDEQELSQLFNDSIRDHCKDFLPISVKQWLIDNKSAQKHGGESNHSKRPLLDDSTEKTISKQRCMDGNDITLRVVGKPTEIMFPDILFDTEMSVAVFFHKQESLVY